jgi:beta-lactam-binding protein with PASTA domain
MHYTYLHVFLDLYKQSVDQVPNVIKSLREKGYNFFTAAACNNDDKPHTILNKEPTAVDVDSVSVVSTGNDSIGAAAVGAVSDTNEVRPLSTQFPSAPSSALPKSAAKKNTAASSAASKSAYSSYALSFATLAVYITAFF